MKITLVTPSKNQGRFIEETIRSVINQEGNFELEYIIMDGGSEDNTLEILKKYDKIIKSKKFKPKCKKLAFKWYSKKDNGQSDAINRGFKMSTGDIINWLCSDDLLENKTLEKVCDFFNKNEKAKIVFGKSRLIDENGIIKDNVISRDFKREELIRCWNAVYNSFALPQATVFVKRDILYDIGYLNEKLHLTMDYEWYLRINKKYKFYFIDEFLARDRAHQNSKSTLFKKKQFKECIRNSKKYWGENYSYYSVSYLFNFLIRWFYPISYKLKKRYPAYKKFLDLIKKTFIKNYI